jgi:copper chaperone CopZ
MRTRTKVLNACLIFVVITILAVLGVYVRTGATADAVAVLQTSGMSCSSCIEKVTKTLQSQKGVAATEVDLAAGRVMAGYDSKQVNPQRLAGKLTESGFASEVEIVVTPEQFRTTVGHKIGEKGTSATSCGAGCCGK